MHTYGHTARPELEYESTNVVQVYLAAATRRTLMPVVYQPLTPD
jgi:hypothetical protein